MERYSSFSYKIDTLWTLTKISMENTTTSVSNKNNESLLISAGGEWRYSNINI